jgi:hypothetical protein
MQAPGSKEPEHKATNTLVPLGIAPLITTETLPDRAGDADIKKITVTVKQTNFIIVSNLGPIGCI